jgi:hypothetical protein
MNDNNETDAEEQKGHGDDESFIAFKDWHPWLVHLLVPQSC